jgi:hypothetical protein
MPFGIGRAILGEGRIGGDGLDAENGEKPFERAVHVGVNMRQNPFKIAHIFCPPA